MNHELLTEFIDSIDELYKKTLAVGFKAYEDENNMTDEAILSDPTSEFYGKKEKYILSKMTFFLCSTVCVFIFYVK